ERQVEAATAASPVVASQSLEGVVITGNSNALLRSDRRLAMLNASLPLDANGRAEQRADWRQLAALFPQKPDAAVGEPRRMMERSLAPPAGSDADGDLAFGSQ
ncbi:MAG TPA: hypothetical protein VNX47_08220, partial [Nevskia sp.]|nr:hypothetical protein [Nevskia sp.]